MNNTAPTAPFPPRANGFNEPSQTLRPVVTIAGAPPASAAPNLGDIYYAIFRHKWKILACTLVGIAAAAAVSRFIAPPYQSEAKLFVRYVIAEKRAPGSDSTAKSPDERGETIMKSEAEILSSLDLARQVVETIGADRILAKLGGGKDANKAMAVIKSNLTVTIAPSSTVMHVSFRHPDPEIVQPVLREIINRYFKLHVETHTANGMMSDFLTQETDQLRSRLSQTEDELRKATGKAGIISLEDSKKANSDQLMAIRRELFNAQADLAERVAVLEELNRRLPARPATEQPLPAVPSDVLAQFEELSQQIQMLQKTERDLLTQFTPQNARVREIRALLTSAQKSRDALKQQHPELTRVATLARLETDTGPDSVTVATQITALQAKIKVLTKQLDDIRADAGRVDQMEGTIVELRRRRELEEANYRSYAASLEQTRINETLGNGHVSNISEIQAPSPPYSDHTSSNRMIGLLLAGGLAVGIAWAFIIELYLDRSIKRAVDIERTLRIPLFLSIPALPRRQLQAATTALLQAPAPNGSDANGDGSACAAATPGEPSETHALQPFHETLRDRLIAYFESIDLTHKPKLVAVTGLRSQSGVTTTAAGLARSLSETGEGSVLLVDMNVGQGVARQFLKGKPVCGLDEMLQARGGAHVDEKLYVVTESNSDRLSRNLPQRFTKLVPRLKASDFDFIIFDMPPVSQISITPRLAGFMDMVLMVVESEKTDRDLVQRAATLLGESRAHVGVILNKTRRYIPARLFQDQLATA